MVNAIEPGEVFPFFVVMGGLLVGLIIAVFAIIAGVLKTRAREETKREMAAYIAEGTMDKETAVALLQAETDAEVKGVCCMIGAGQDGAAHKGPAAAAVT